MNVELKEISFGFNKDTLLLNNVDLTLEGGRIYGLSGNNGSGKTTLLNIISGFVRPLKGAILIDDTLVKKTRPFQFNRAGICRTFQDLRLVGSLTVRQNIRLAFRGNPSDKWFNALLPPSFFYKTALEHEERVNQIVHDFFLDDVQHTLACEISYGQQKLLNLACCFANDAQVFLLDEPVAGINNHHKQNLAQAIRHLASKNKSVLIIEHDNVFVDQIASTKYHLVNGSINIDNNHYLTQEKQKPEKHLQQNLRQDDENFILQVENLNAGYDKKPVLFDVSLNLQKGMLVLLTGGNGSGKSTLLKTIFGLRDIKYFSGRIIFDHTDITQCKSHQLVRKGLVYVPQKNNIFENLTVKETLEVAVNNTSTKACRKLQIKRVFDYLPQLAIHEARKPVNMSGGERQLLALGMALMYEPKLVLLDEPVTGLSNENYEEIFRVIKDLKEKQVAFLIVEHNIERFSGLIDNTIEMRFGKTFN